MESPSRAFLALFKSASSLSNLATLLRNAVASLSPSSFSLRILLYDDSRSLYFLEGIVSSLNRNVSGADWRLGPTFCTIISLRTSLAWRLASSCTFCSEMVFLRRVMSCLRRFLSASKVLIRFSRLRIFLIFMLSSFCNLSISLKAFRYFFLKSAALALAVAKSFRSFSFSSRSKVIWCSRSAILASLSCICALKLSTVSVSLSLASLMFSNFLFSEVISSFSWRSLFTCQFILLWLSSSSRFRVWISPWRSRTCILEESSSLLVLCKRPWISANSPRRLACSCNARSLSASRAWFFSCTLSSSWWRFSFCVFAMLSFSSLSFSFLLIW